MTILFYTHFARITRAKRLTLLLDNCVFLNEINSLANSNIVLDMVLEDYPELGTTDATGYSHDFKYREYTLDSVYSFVELESIDEETYDSLWDSYVKASEDYARYDPTKPYMLTLVLPDNNTYYISDTDDGTYIEFKEKIFG